MNLETSAMGTLGISLRRAVDLHVDARERREVLDDVEERWRALFEERGAAAADHYVRRVIVSLGDGEDG